MPIMRIFLRGKINVFKSKLESNLISFELVLLVSGFILRNASYLGLFQIYEVRGNFSDSQMDCIVDTAWFACPPFL